MARAGRPIGVRLPVDLGGWQALQGTIGELLFAADAYTPPDRIRPEDIVAAGKTAYYVSLSGNNALAGTSPGTAWQTVTKVNASAFNPGDGVFFEAGSTFSDAILSPPSNGSSGSPVVFGSYGTGGMGILSLGVTAPSGRQYVTLDSLRTKNFLGAPGGGAKTKMRAQNCVIGGFSTEYGHECASTTDTGWEFVACEISDTRDSGIITWSDGTLVEGCRIHDVGTMWDNAAYNYGLHGIYSKSPNAVIRSNEIWNVLDPDGQCVSSRFRGALIESNYCHDSFEFFGFYNDDATAPGSSRTTVIRYNLADRVQNGVLVDANGNTVAGMPENFRIYNNTIRTSLKANAGSTYSTPIRYYNNGGTTNKGTELILKNNILVVGPGVSNYAIIDVKDSPTLTTYQETNNLLYVTSFGFYAERNGSGASSLAAWQTLTSQGTNDLAVDPLIDANMQPAFTSVVRNAGTTSVSGATFVAAANHNPLSYSESAPDMGAWEFIVASAVTSITCDATQPQAAEAARDAARVSATTQAQSAAQVRSPAHRSAATQAQAAGQARSATRSSAATQAQSAAQSRRANRVSATTQAQSAAATPLARRVVTSAATQAQSAAQSRSIAHTSSTTQAQAAAQVRRANRVSGATQAQSAAAAKTLAEIIATTQAQAAVVVRARPITSTTTQAQVAAQVRSVGHRSAATQAQSAAQSRSTARSSATTQAQAAAQSRRANRSSSTTQAQAAVAVATRSLLITSSATQAQVASTLRVTAHKPSTTQAQAAAQVRRANHTSAATQPQAAAYSRLVARIVAMTQAQAATATPVTASQITCSATQAQAATVMRVIGETVTLTQAQAAAQSRRANHASATTQAQAAGQTHTTNRSSSTTQAQAAAAVKSKASIILSAATQAQAAAATRSLTHTPSATQTQAAVATRLPSIRPATTQPQLAGTTRSTTRRVAITQPQVAVATGTRSSLVTITTTQPQVASASRGFTRSASTTQPQAVVVTLTSDTVIVVIPAGAILFDTLQCTDQNPLGVVYGATPHPVEYVADPTP